MARLAGLIPHERWAGWSGEPFTGDSEAHVSVWRTGQATPAARRNACTAARPSASGSAPTTASRVVRTAALGSAAAHSARHRRGWIGSSTHAAMPTGTSSRASSASVGAGRDAATSSDSASASP